MIMPFRSMTSSQLRRICHGHRTRRLDQLDVQTTHLFYAELWEQLNRELYRGALWVPLYEYLNKVAFYG